MSKTILLPLVSAAAIIVKNVAGIEIGTEIQNAVVDIILGGLTIYGIVKNHFNKTPQQ